MMFQLIYASAATRNISHEELSALLLKARANNSTLGITGMMLYHSGSFLQVLEGERDSVEILFLTIKSSGKHGAIKIIYRGEIDQREFEEWSMGFSNTSDCPDMPEGFVDYLTELETRTLGKTRAKKILKMFQEGTWRQSVDR
jgi:Sensors of blue-light using FAD